MIVAGAAAFLLTLFSLRPDTVRVDVAVAVENLAPGTAIRESDFTGRSIEVSSADDLSGLLSVGDVSRLLADGARSTRPIPAGTLVGPGDLAVVPVTVSRAMSFPIDRAHAVGGALAPGDRIDLVSVDGGVARFVLVDAVVTSVSEPASTGRSFWLTVEVDAAGSLRLGRAVAGTSLYVVRSTWAPPADPAMVDPPPLLITGIGNA